MEGGEIETLDQQEDLSSAERPISFDDIIPISAKEGKGLDRLLLRVREVIDEHYEKERTVEDSEDVTMPTSKAGRL